MKELKNILLGSLLAFGIGCSSSQKIELPDIPVVPGNLQKREFNAIILPDIYGAHELAFPDTSKYKEMEDRLLFLESGIEGKMVALEKLFDSNSDGVPDLMVSYRLKDFFWNKLDSSRAPIRIIKAHEGGRFVLYLYQKHLQKYIKWDEKIIDKRNRYLKQI